MGYHAINNIKIDTDFKAFVDNELLSGLNMDKDKFWQDFSTLIYQFAPRNIELLATRQKIQQQIQQWHRDNPNFHAKKSEYKHFLHDIGYIEQQGDDFKIGVSDIDHEISSMPAPQLVVPVKNARFALNAANARWGSLYDALYGSDAIAPPTDAKGYDVARGKKVIAWGRDFLSKHLPLNNGDYHHIAKFSVNNGKLDITLSDNTVTNLKDAQQFIGYTGDAGQPSSVVFKHHHLHIQILIDANHAIGKDDDANIADIMLEAAGSVIMDLEDSIAAVDSEDKIDAYKNWLGLMKGDLSVDMERNGKKFTRKLHDDKSIISALGNKIALRGRSLMLIRNVGHLMTNNTILWDNDDKEIPEGIMDSVITSLIGMYDLNKSATDLHNSSQKSIYIVKPKMHASLEAQFSNELFNAVEDMLGLKRHTIKIGVMDEERRTSLNLKEVIRAVKNRLFFINTGFLDRTGDEIHTSMYAGAMILKNDMKAQQWLISYEDNNVAVGMQCGLDGVAQIGKGMWAKPDSMKEMMQQKSLPAGANTGWVPSPTAATLHSIYFHDVDVKQRQEDYQQADVAKLDRLRDGLLEIPLARDAHWSDSDIQNELDNNIQSLLGYVVKWIHNGIGCSKVADINNVNLMEDRATLRISSQHIHNWYCHNIVSKELIEQRLRAMALIVDQQNAHDGDYIPLIDGSSNRNFAFEAAHRLIFEAAEQPSGYTEPLLHHIRFEFKQ